MPSVSARCYCAALLAFTALCASAQPSKKSAAEWQAMARADLDAVRDIILKVHPGSIDELNPGFKDWTEQGYREALQLIPRVNSYDAMMAVPRYYVTGYYDGHFVYSDDVRDNKEQMLVNGWRASKQGSDYVVYATMPDWPAPLPPVGARVVQCDGLNVHALIDRNAAPYFDRRQHGERHRLSTTLTMPTLPDLALKQCEFRTAAGAQLKLPVVYHHISTDAYFKGPRPPELPRTRRSNRFTFEDGVLWVYAPSFSSMPSPGQVAEFNAMLEGLSKVQDARLIVFDVRGNGGGSSLIGSKIFDAATGGLQYDQTDIDKVPRSYAQWRVSDVLLATAEKFNREWPERFGANSQQARLSASMLKEVQEAKAKGEQWIRQPGPLLISRAEIAKRNGKLARHGGAVALLTDSQCASACLDFADMVLSVPGAVHLGQTTSFDSLYLEVGQAKLPSGNKVGIPLKVWRNRLRGNNEALRPDIVLKADMNDDAAVQAATLAALKPRLHTTAAK